MKSRIFIIGILLTLSLASSAHAKTDITGDAYNGLVSTMNMGDVGYGVTIEDLNMSENCDNSAQTCLFEGFSWADKIGWTVWDGMDIRNTPGMGAGNFPDEYLAKATYNGNLSGFIWGEKYGWVSLSACTTKDQTQCTTGPAVNYCKWTGSSCDIDEFGQIPRVGTQDNDDWGVYIDFCPQKADQNACTNVLDDSDTYCNWDGVDNVCVFDRVNNPNGQPFKGNAWSEHLGWIKFGPESGETEFAGAFTEWFPDLTPPVYKGIEPAWISTDDTFGNIDWLEFADENDSYVNLVAPHKSTITVTSIDPSPCVVPTAQTNGNLVISHGNTGEANLTIPAIGRIGAPTNGFCRYTLGGVLYNASGFGHYFGPEGALIAVNDDGVNLLSPAPNIYDPNPVNLYVKAGELIPYFSNLNVYSSAKPIADGSETIRLALRLMDVAGNSIMPIKSAITPVVIPEPDSDLWVRDVELLYDFDSSEYYFDSLDWTRDVILGNNIPVDIEGTKYGSWSSLFADPVTPFQYPPDGASRPTLVNSNYIVDVIGYAPSSPLGNSLVVGNVETTATDLALPAVSPSQPGIPAVSDTVVLGTSGSVSIAGLPHIFEFDPVLEVTSGELDVPFIVISTPAEATYELVNNSNIVLNAYNLDHILSLKDVSAGIGEALLEIGSINLSSIPTDAPGQTDPDSGETRYSLFQGAGISNDNMFHNPEQNYHDPSYSFGSDLDADGIYKISGDLYVEPTHECQTDPLVTCPEVDLDRSDPFSIDVSTPLGKTDTFSFAFTPSQYIGETVDAQINFGITQYIGHPAPAPYAHLSALYPATKYIDGIEVKSVGLSTSGTVSGGQVFETGRDLETITTTSSADLRKEIRKNVAVLTRNFDSCNGPATLGDLPTSGPCVTIDDNKNTYTAYFDLGLNSTLSLENVADLITVPAGYKYTIILEGINLNIGANLIYDDQDNSLGIIVMKDSNGDGGEVFIHPSVTNVVGLLYAEGSVRSSPDSGATFYYGAAGGNSNQLKNQLYWQGSIASKNTIGGAPKKVTPVGADCSPWDNGSGVIDKVGCAQAYDFDFIRRFSTIHADPANVDYTSPGTFFSGGGYCVLLPSIACTPATLPTTIDLNAGNTIDVANSKSLDTFFIERDNRPVPPGFSSSGGLTSSQEIR